MSEAIVMSSSPLPDASCLTPRGDARIVWLPAGHILQILGRPFGEGLEARLRALSGAAPHAVRAAGPGVWFLVGEAPRDIEASESALGAEAGVVDQTHGRVRIGVVGAGAARLLATGTALDLSLSRCPIGFCGETLFGHIGVHLTRTGADSFELLVGRSFAASLWHELTG